METRTVKITFHPGANPATVLATVLDEAVNAGDIHDWQYAPNGDDDNTPGIHDDYSESECCPDGWGCPDCNECRMDFLTPDEDGEIITCLTCGESYTVHEETQHDRPEFPRGEFPNGYEYTHNMTEEATQ